MNQQLEFLTRAFEAAALFDLKLRRMLHKDVTSQSWLVTHGNSSLDEARGSELGSGAPLYRMVILGTPAESNAVLAFTEAQADETALELGIVDMCIDERIGAVFVFDYQPALSMETNWNNNPPSVAELCSALIAVLAIMVRVNRLGYCLGKLGLDSLMVDRCGAVFLRDAGDMHSSSVGRQCCASGVDGAALIALVGAATPETDVDPVLSALQYSLECDSGESALEVGVHHFSLFVTPATIQLRTQLDTGKRREFQTHGGLEVPDLPAPREWQRKLQSAFTQTQKLLRL